MSFQDLVASVRRVSEQAGLRLPMAKLNDAISIALFNKHYSQCVASDHAGALPPAPNPPPYVNVAAERYRVQRAHLERAIQLGRGELELVTTTEPAVGQLRYRLPLALISGHTQQDALRAKGAHNLYVSWGQMRGIQLDTDDLAAWLARSSRWMSAAAIDWKPIWKKPSCRHGGS